MADNVIRFPGPRLEAFADELASYLGYDVGKIHQTMVEKKLTFPDAVRWLDERGELAEEA